MTSIFNVLSHHLIALESRVRTSLSKFLTRRSIASQECQLRNQGAVKRAISHPRSSSYIHIFVENSSYQINLCKVWKDSAADVLWLFVV